MERKAPDRIAESGRACAPAGFNGQRAQGLEQGDRGGDAIVKGPLEPVEGARIGAPRNNLQHRGRKIDA